MTVEGSRLQGPSRSCRSIAGHSSSQVAVCRFFIVNGINHNDTEYRPWVRPFIVAVVDALSRFARGAYDSVLAG